MHSYIDFSNLLSDKNIRAGFTNRYFPHSPPQDRIEFAKLLHLHPDSLVIPNQVHSGNVEVVNKPGIYQNTDGIITKNKDLILSIQVADCVPIFIVDPENQLYGLMHAGWRGVTNGIVENGIAKLKSLGSNEKNLCIILGPSIQKCCFEVGLEVAIQFPDNFIHSGKGDKSFVDLAGVIRDKMIESGLSSDSIINMDECTSCLSEKYYSFRREGSKAKRMIAILGWQASF